MDLPKNITQVGEVNRTCKVYVEDYVISYLKQLNRVATDKALAVAMYGIRKEEGEVTYLFLYGACKLNFLQREARHLSQAQQQEIEKLRKRYFADYEFQGYRLLNGEMIEGFHVCEQGICRYIAGYAQFYEKNDAMLAYMLEVREQETAPEVVDSEKYEAVKKRQEERKIQSEGLSEREREDLAETWKSRKNDRRQDSTGLRGMKIAAVAVFVLLCLAGVYTLEDGGGLKEMVKGVTEQKLPDAQEVGSPNVQTADNVLITEDKLSQALQQENQAAGGKETKEGADSQGGEASGISDSTDKMEGETSQESNASQENNVTDMSDSEEDEKADEKKEETSVSAQTTPVSYIIKEGDTLNGISLRNYGTKDRVAEICTLNKITNPDDIKVGQKILLP